MWMLFASSGVHPRDLIHRAHRARVRRRPAAVAHRDRGPRRPPARRVPAGRTDALLRERLVSPRQVRSRSHGLAAAKL